MRTDGNPIKQGNAQTPAYLRHRLIMPVYIPSQVDYYRDALQIFKICLDSLNATVQRNRMSITIIDNASIPEVGEYVQLLMNDGKVDQYLRNSVNRGKADAIIGCAKACYEPFITISDADVLFLPGWLDRIEQVYSAFPQAGVVCPFPAPNLRHLHCTSSWINHLGKIRYGKFVTNQTFDDLERTLGLPGFYDNKERNIQCSISSTNLREQVLIGAGHFVACYRKCVFDQMQYVPQCKGLKGGLRNIEATVDRLGLSRLSIAENAVKHMGNLWESWMTVPPVSAGKNISTELRESAAPGKSRVIPVWLRSWFARPLILLDRVKRRA
jgi:Glycosyl transferase family 2